MQKNVPVQNLPKNSNLEQIDRISLDQNVQSEILEDLIGGKKKKLFFKIKNFDIVFWNFWLMIMVMAIYTQIFYLGIDINRYLPIGILSLYSSVPDGLNLKKSSTKSSAAASTVSSKSMVSSISTVSSSVSSIKAGM